MSNVKTFVTGMALEPVSSDPGSPIEGQLQMSSGVHRPKGLWVYKDAAWSEAGGSGGGSLDTFYAESCETNGSSTLTSGQDADFDNGGSIGGTLTDETSAPLAGDASYSLENPVTNDWVASPVIELDLKQRGNHVGLNLYYTYTGTDDYLKVVVYDVTNSAVISSDLDLLKAQSNSTRYTTSVYIPSSCEEIKVGIHCVTGETAVLLWDDIQLSTNPFVYKNLVNIDDWDDFGGSLVGWGNATHDLKSRRVGDTFEVQGRITIERRCIFHS